MTKKSKNVDISKNKKSLFILLVVIVLLSILLIVSESLGNFSKVRLKKNSNTIFSVSDLQVNKLSYSNTEKQVRKEMGKPKKEKKFKKDIYSYKKLVYDGITFTLKENYDDFMLVKVEITSRKYKVSRGIKVGDSVSKVVKKYRIDNSRGTYMYGNYSIDSLNESEITETIYFGVRNKREIIYVNRDAIVGNDKSNIAKLDMYYKYGKIKKIIWSYDFE